MGEHRDNALETLLNRHVGASAMERACAAGQTGRSKSLHHLLGEVAALATIWRTAGRLPREPVRAAYDGLQGPLSVLCGQAAGAQKRTVPRAVMVHGWGACRRGTNHAGSALLDTETLLE